MLFLDSRKSQIFSLISLVVIATFISTHANAVPNKPASNDDPIEILSDTLRYIPEENLAIFSGKVETTQGTMKLYCDVMKVKFYEKEESLNATTANKIKHIFVTGNVKLVTPTEKAESERGEFDEGKSLIYLFDNVRLYQGDNLLKGDKLTYSTITGESLLGSNKSTKRVTGIFIPKRENDK